MYFYFLQMSKSNRDIIDDDATSLQNGLLQLILTKARSVISGHSIRRRQNERLAKENAAVVFCFVLQGSGG